MKKILFGTIGLVVLLVVVAGVLVVVTPSDFAVEKEIVINKPKTEVFAYLRLVKNQDDWSPWTKKDPKIKQSYEGTDGTEGFVYKWDSDHPKVGKGTQTTKKIVDGERIDTELHFEKPFESVSPAYIITESVGDNKTKVKWGFSGSMPKPMNLMLLFMDIETEAGAEFDLGLKALKEELEKRSAESTNGEADIENDKDKKSNDIQK